MTVTALFLFDGASPDSAVMQHLNERGVTVRTTSSLAQAMSLVNSPLASHASNPSFSDLSIVTSSAISEGSQPSNYRLIVAEVSAGGISLAEYIAEQYSSDTLPRPCIVLLDQHQDIGAARRALRLAVEAYLLSDDRPEQKARELDRVMTKASAQVIRMMNLDTPRVIRQGWTSDSQNKQVAARLSTIESAIMTCLTDQVGLPVSAKSIVSMVMGRELDEDKAASLLRPHISRLRSKLEPMPQMPQHLLTVRGKGYMVV